MTSQRLRNAVLQTVFLLLLTGPIEAWARETEASAASIEVPLMTRKMSMRPKVMEGSLLKDDEGRILALDEIMYYDENQSHYDSIERPINPKTTVLILMDVWDTDTTNTFGSRIARNIETSILKLVSMARKSGVKIVHLPHEGKISRRIPYDRRDVVIRDDAKLFPLLRKHGIETLIYAGYSANICLLYRPGGIVAANREGFTDIILVRDATVAYESPETLPQELAKETVVHQHEIMFGTSSTVTDLEAALSRVPPMPSSKPSPEAQNTPSAQ